MLGHHYRVALFKFKYDKKKIFGGLRSSKQKKVF